MDAVACLCAGVVGRVCVDDALFCVFAGLFIFSFLFLFIFLLLLFCSFFYFVCVLLFFLHVACFTGDALGFFVFCVHVCVCRVCCSALRVPPAETRLTVYRRSELRKQYDIPGTRASAFP